MKNYNESYNGGARRRLIKQVNEYGRKDMNSYMFKHLIEAKFPTVTLDNFTVLSSGCHNRILRGKYHDPFLSNRKELR